MNLNIRCPECGAIDGGINVEGVPYLVCTTHRLGWPLRRPAQEVDSYEFVEPNRSPKEAEA